MMLLLFNAIQCALHSYTWYDHISHLSPGSDRVLGLARLVIYGSEKKIGKKKRENKPRPRV